MQRFKVLCLACLLVLGCQSNPKVVLTDAETAQLIATRNVKLKALKPWRAIGSLAVDSEREGVINASFAWDVDDTGFDIRIIGPLGLKTYRIVENQQGALLTGEDGELAGPSAEQLLYDVMGVRIPLVSMQDWVVGLQGEAKDAERDQQGLLKQMQVIDGQLRWQVKFRRYATGDELPLPKRIEVSGDDVEIVLSIKKWSKPNAVDSNRLIIPTGQ